MLLVSAFSYEVGVSACFARQKKVNQTQWSQLELVFALVCSSAQYLLQPSLV